MLRVLPGFELTFAIFLPSSALISVDFPTFERPTKAISGLSGGGSWPLLNAVQKSSDFQCAIALLARPQRELENLRDVRDVMELHALQHPRAQLRRVGLVVVGQYYVSDYWGYIYNVPLGEGVPSNYTATKAYAVSMDNNNSMSSGPNLVWDGENHLFYYYLSVPQSANRSDSRYTNGDEYRLEGMEAHGDFPAAVNLDDLELLWLGKGMRDFETRSTTATAVMRSSEGDLRFIHFAFGSGDGYDDVVIESEPAEFGQYTVDENSKFATTVAFPNQIFFTDNSGGIYCLYNASDNKEVVQVANIGLGNEIVDMQFRIPVNSQNGLPSSVEGEEFTRFLAIAYNMPDGTGCVLELKFATSGAVERQTLYTGFERISQIEYMPRMTSVDS